MARPLKEIKITTKLTTNKEINDIISACKASPEEQIEMEIHFGEIL